MGKITEESELSGQKAGDSFENNSLFICNTNKNRKSKVLHR